MLRKHKGSEAISKAHVNALKAYEKVYFLRCQDSINVLQAESDFTPVLVARQPPRFVFLFNPNADPDRVLPKVIKASAPAAHMRLLTPFSNAAPMTLFQGSTGGSL
jgi:hypothetical protein